MRPSPPKAAQVQIELEDLARAHDDDRVEQSCLEFYGPHAHSHWEPWRPHYGPWYPAGYSAREAGANGAGQWSTVTSTSTS